MTYYRATPWPTVEHFVEHPRITRFEWVCQQCGRSGPGLMPEEHASGACDATKTAIVGFRTWECHACGQRGDGPLPDPHASLTCVAAQRGFVDGGGI